MNETVKDELKLFISIVHESFQRLLRKHRIALCVIFLAVFFIGFSLAIGLEALFYLPAAIKMIIILFLLIISVGAVTYAHQQLNSPSFKEFYQQFGKKQDARTLSDALDLYYESNTRSSPFYTAAVQQNIVHLSPRNITTKLNTFVEGSAIHTYYRNGLGGFLIGLLLLTVFISLQPGAVSRLAHMWSNYAPPNPYNYTIKPGDMTLEQGQSFTPKINFKGDHPDEVSLAFKTSIENEFRYRNPVSVENGEVIFPPISPTMDGHYYFVMDEFESEHYQIKVQLRPRFEQLSLKMIPPSYTNLDTTSYSYPFSKITAYRGSKVILHAITNKAVSHLTLLRSAVQDSIALASSSTDSVSFGYQWVVESSDTVTFNMTDKAGLSNQNNFRIIIEPNDDRLPFVNLIEPTENLRMQTPESLQLKYEAGDDFGLTGASLHYEIQRAFVENTQKGAITLPDPAINQVQSYKWAIPEIKPKPRDVITYWIEVKDNDAYKGAKTGRSQKLTVTFPSMTEYLNELDSKESDVSESLENISNSFNKMQKQYDQFKQQLKQNPNTNWKQQQSLSEVQKQKQKIDKQLKKINEEFGEIRKELEKSRLMSPETMEAYKELQELMKEINSPELAEALEKLRQSLGEMNPEQLRSALQNYEFNEKLYKERIQRTLELFKSLKLNSDLEKMAVSLEKLAEQEQQLIESTEAEKDLKQQKVIQKDLQKVQKQLEELSKSITDKVRNQIEKLQKEAGQKLDQINKSLQKNIEQLKRQRSSSEQKQNSRQQQQNIQKQMQQMAQQMRNAKQQLNQQRKSINAAALKYILYSLINLSQNQEELTKETEDLPYRSKAFVEKAREEQNIAMQFSMLSDSLFKVSSVIPGFSNQINKKKMEVETQLKQTVDLLAERDRTKAVNAMQQSLGGINGLATMIASLLEQLQNQQGGNGGGSMSMQQFIEQLQKMSGQQQELNQQIQQMINDIQGNRLTQSQMERLNQLSRQQNKIRKQLEELKRKGVLGTGDKILSELERMSESMENTINDLRGAQLNRELVQRQQNILSRMLAAKEAVQERGKEEQREATAAQDSPRSNPPDVTLEELQQKIRKMLNDPNQTKFKEDYQRLIEQYFELLRKQAEGRQEL